MHGDPINTLRTKVPVRTAGKVKAATEEHMNSLADKPERVKAKATFQDPFVK
jgi:hypothetical protein